MDDIAENEPGLEKIALIETALDDNARDKIGLDEIAQYETELNDIVTLHYCR